MMRKVRLSDHKEASFEHGAKDAEDFQNNAAGEIYKKCSAGLFLLFCFAFLLHRRIANQHRPDISTRLWNHQHTDGWNDMRP